MTMTFKSFLKGLLLANLLSVMPVTIIGVIYMIQMPHLNHEAITKAQELLNSLMILPGGTLCLSAVILIMSLPFIIGESL